MKRREEKGTMVKSWEELDEVCIHSSSSSRHSQHPVTVDCTPRPIKKLATAHPTSSQGSNASTTDAEGV